ncbi:MAG: glutathione S-transferase N-terminal domain-containing protein [Rhodobacterales bacterium]|nr:glutathione S-transferase N-terminal domain-containing protein [Rhodobacterales bacterium]
MSHITIYTRDGCEPCRKAKALLSEHGLQYREVDVLSGPEARDEFLSRAPGAKTVPQIVISDQVIGGYTDLVDLIDTAQFQQMIGGR